MASADFLQEETIQKCLKGDNDPVAFVINICVRCIYWRRAGTLFMIHLPVAAVLPSQLASQSLSQKISRKILGGFSLTVQNALKRR